MTLKPGNVLTDPLPDRYTLGFRDDWPSLVNILVDLKNSANYDETSIRVLRLLMDGYSFREIGKILGMSHNTAIKKLRLLITG